ncbi:hypothetical protein GCWU000325_00263 [Alloprevotella tannerae ATCC 51259]|uniref:Uncharacterized protein n=1 Tax=Alloprevotella tannerae ATCC 51259 TaxID=626522 RepID=C9LDJ2_9BACT|nr:hypothetical protein GCWU000325_00263 [Alloprevotella tannerae ATCC 51259]
MRPFSYQIVILLFPEQTEVTIIGRIFSSRFFLSVYQCFAYQRTL